MRSVSSNFPSPLRSAPLSLTSEFIASKVHFPSRTASYGASYDRSVIRFLLKKTTHMFCKKLSEAEPATR